jgi:hypothetical protein
MVFGYLRMDELILVCFFRNVLDGSVRRRYPAGVGIEEEEENHAQGHQVHVDEEENTTVVEAPARLHAADGVDGAGDSGEGRENEERCGAVMREVG